MKCGECPLWCGSWNVLYCGLTGDPVEEDTNCSRTQEEVNRLFEDIKNNQKGKR